jgi:hypothetical protein
MDEGKVDLPYEEEGDWGVLQTIIGKDWYKNCL